MLASGKWNISSMFEPKSLVVKNRSVDYERAHICLSLSSLCDTAAGRRRYCNAWYTTKIFSKFQGFSMSFTYCDVFCLKIGEHFIKCRTKRLRSQSELVREEKNKQHRWCPPQKFAIRVLVHAAGLGTCYFRLWPPSFLSSFAGERKMGFFAILSVLLSISSQKIDRRHPHPTATLSTSSLCPYPPFISKRLLTPLLRRFGWQNIIKMQIGSSFSAPVLFSQIPSNSVWRFVGRIWQKRFRQWS